MALPMVGVVHKIIDVSPRTTNLLDDLDDLLIIIKNSPEYQQLRSQLLSSVVF